MNCEGISNEINSSIASLILLGLDETILQKLLSKNTSVTQSTLTFRGGSAYGGLEADLSAKTQKRVNETCFLRYLRANVPARMLGTAPDN